jgi:hypothetical protein
MLEPWIIDQIRRREEERRRGERPQLELPIPDYPPDTGRERDPAGEDESEPTRGVAIIAM